MKYLLGSLLLLFVHTAQAADNSGKYAIWGAGQKSCFRYNAARSSGEDDYYRYFLMGYLTAYNTQTPETYRISGGNDMPAILSWLDDFCTSKQSQGFELALIEFIAEHYPKRYKRRPVAGR